MEEITGSASVASTSATGPAVEGMAGDHIHVDGRNHLVSRVSLDTLSNTYRVSSSQRLKRAAYARLEQLEQIALSGPPGRALHVEDLNGNELEAVLTDRVLDPVLEELYVSFPGATTDADITTMCVTLGRILHTFRTLSLLDLRWCRLTAEGEGHLLSGLQGNADPALEELHLPKWESGAQIAKIILSAPRLRKLGLWDITVLDDDTVPLANALARCTSLNSLVLDIIMMSHRSASELLLGAVTGAGSSASISYLELSGVMERTGVFLHGVLSSNKSLKYLAWDSRRLENMNTNQWWDLGNALVWNSSLKLFRILVRWSSFRGDATGGVQALLSAVTNQDPKPCIRLYLISNSARKCKKISWGSSCESTRVQEAEDLLGVDMKKPIIELHLVLEDVVQNKPDAMWGDLAMALSIGFISSLHLEMCEEFIRTQGIGKENFWKALRECSTLRLLTIEGGKREYCPGGWKEVLDCLLSKTSRISHLRLTNCEGLDEDVFEQLMGILRVKSTLERIGLKGTSWETDGKKNLIEKALERNAKQVTNSSMFTDREFQVDPRRNGRLFLCGSPSEGKTSLRHTMTRTGSWRTKMGRGVKTFTGGKKSNGIKVKLLREDHDTEMQIAVWDLPNEWSFFTLQYIFFPRSNHAFIFLFVFSPYDGDTQNIKPDLEECFKTELDEFLLCISSNPQIIGQEMVPLVVVVVVLSRKGKERGPSTTWATGSIEDLRRKYQDRVNIGDLYEVDTRKEREVRPIIDYIVDSFTSLSRNLNPIVPVVCSQISSVLAKRTKDIQQRPVWPSADFHKFCKAISQDVNSLAPEAAQTEVLEAMVSHLHDTGMIIIIPNSQRIIVDPTGLINIFLGKLETIGQNFQLKRSAVQKSMSLERIFTITGPVSSYDIQSQLLTFLGKNPTCLLGRTSAPVLELLNHFSSLNTLKGVDAQYYTPILEANQRKGTGMESLSCSSSLEDGQVDGLESIGFRVQCGSRNRTSSSEPQFQMYIRHKLKLKST